MTMNGGLWKYQYGITRMIKEDMHLPSLRLRRAICGIQTRHGQYDEPLRIRQLDARSCLRPLIALSVNSHLLSLTLSLCCQVCITP